MDLHHHHSLQIAWQDFMLPCPSKLLTGIDCPGCGLQRSAVLLLRGDWLEAFWMYPALYPLLLFGILVAATRVFPERILDSALRWSAVATVTLALLNFAIKLIR